MTAGAVVAIIAIAATSTAVGWRAGRAWEAAATQITRGDS